MEKLTKAPVFYALAQIHFNPVSLMGDYVPKIQERLRQKFPDFRQEMLQRIELKVGEKSDIQTHGMPRWNFMNSKGTEGYLLHTDSLVFHTTKYDRFSVLLEQLLVGLKLIHEVVLLSYVERIGLRYLNAVTPYGQGEGLDKYLLPCVLGLSHASLGTLSHNFLETAFQNLCGTLGCRIVIRDNAIGMPADLHPLALRIEERFASIMGLHAILDYDQFAEERFDFKVEDIESKLKLMHDLVSKVFEATVTPFALEQWK